MKAKYFLLFVVYLATLKLSAQTTIYYSKYQPADTLRDEYFMQLKHAAQDLADIWNKAHPAGNYVIAELPQTAPTSGIILKLDPNFVYTGLQDCQMNIAGNLMTFTSSNPRGVAYGVFENLEERGFRFFNPDTLWWYIPAGVTPFNGATTNKLYKPFHKEHEWSGLGGWGSIPYGAPTLDSTTGRMVDHPTLVSWYKHQRRNNMHSEYYLPFQPGGYYLGNGLLDSIEVQKHLDVVLNRPCWIAEVDSSHDVYNGTVTWVSTPNVAIDSAMDHWAWWVYRTNYKYPKQMNTDDPYYLYSPSIEVEDGARWEETYFSNCPHSNLSPSDQAFKLNNRVAKMLKDSIPGIKSMGCLAYTHHSDTPSVAIDPLIDVMVTKEFQNHSSPFELMQKWKKKHGRISEYEIYNGGEVGSLPFSNWNYFVNQANRIKDQNTLGVFAQSNASKFTGSFYAYFINRFLKSHTDMNVSFNEYLTLMYGSAAPVMKELFELWMNENNYLSGSNQNDNIYKFPLYIQKINQAVAATSDPKVLQRLREVKVYLHFMSKYIDAARSSFVNIPEKRKTVDSLVAYLARTRDISVVNTPQMGTNAVEDLFLDRQYQMDKYFGKDWSITVPAGVDSVWDYVALGYIPYDHNDTTKHPKNKWYKLGGYVGPGWPTLAVPQITNAQIDADYQYDQTRFAPYPNTQFIFDSVPYIISKTGNSKMQMRDTIKMHFQLNSYGPAWKVYAPMAGSIKFQYKVINAKGTKGGISITLDHIDQQSYSRDTFKLASVTGISVVTLPKAGHYILRINPPSSAVITMDLKIISGGNYIYKNYPIGGEGFERYYELPDDSTSTLKGDLTSYGPRYFYMPKNVGRLYFAITTRCDTTCSTLTELKDQWVIKLNDSTVYDNWKTTNDSSLFYIEVADSLTERFWILDGLKAQSFSFANITNNFFYLMPEQPVSVNKPIKLKASVHPNPSNGKFTLTPEQAYDQVDVICTDITGRTIYNNRFNRLDGPVDIDFGDICNSPGVYFIRLENKDGSGNQRMIILGK